MELDSHSPTAAPGTLTVGLYTPYLQGFYIGELVNQIRQLCFVKGYRLVVIRTGGYGKFQSALQLEQIDCAIFIRNSVSAEFADTLFAAKPCVAIAYDFFPLAIPVVASDHEFGIGLAMDYLLNNGHRKIAFVGDLGQYDLRKRYEFYCDAQDQYRLEFNENYVFAVDDTQFSGGRQAAQRFIEKNCDATGIIFGAGLTGIGFLQYLKASHPDLAEKIQGICFDALALIPVLTPELVSIDQNLHLLAYRALNVLESQLAHKEVSTHVLVEPKLTRVQSDAEARYDGFMATCADFADFHNPHYVKTLLANMREWPGNIADSGLDQLMCMSPLFGRFMDAAFLLRHFVDNNQKSWIKQTKAFLAESISKTDPSDSASLCREEKYPPASMREFLQDKYDFQLHMPIYLYGKVWGFLSIVGHSANTSPVGSFFGFGGYIESVVRQFELNLEIKTLHKKIADHTNLVTPEYIADREARITWNFEDGLTVWSEKALQKLGFQTAMELNIYSNMDLTDRVHKDDLPSIRQYVAQSMGDKKGFQAQLRYKMKNGQFHDAVLEAEPILDADQKMTGLRFYLGVNYVL
jgi:DNA-binding LacI/PurR family transcriptional regulator